MNSNPSKQTYRRWNAGFMSGNGTTLRGQLFASVSLVFFMAFIGLMLAGVTSNRSSLERQLGAQAQDTASALSADLSQALARNDINLANIQVMTVFDRGHFERITVFASDGSVLLNRESPVMTEGVPQWFTRLVSLAAPAKEAFFSAGWRDLGKVTVVSQPTYAYQNLWQSCLETATWTLLAYLFALLLMHLVLRLILQPLSEIGRAALEISERHFVQISVIPETQELAQVVLAMNEMSRRIAEILDAETARAENFRKEAYQDEVTGLDNRRSFDLRFNQLLDGDMVFSDAVLIGLEVNNLKDFNAENSYQRGNALLTRMAQMASELLAEHAAILGRTGGASFGFVTLGLDAAAIKDVVQQLRGQLQQAIAATANGADLSFSLGVVSFNKSDARSQVMARLDLAIETARQLGRNAVHFVMHDHAVEETIGSQGWRELIRNALHENRWVLLGQPVVFLADQKLIHQEIVTRLMGHDGKLIPAASFLPMALRHHLMADVDRSLLELVFRLFEISGAEARNLAANLSSQSLASKDFCKWLDVRLETLGEGARYFSFELTEHACSMDVEATRHFASMVHARGAAFGIDNFGLAPNSLQMLRELAPDYIKLAAGLVQEGQKTEDAHSLIQSIVALAHSMDIEVIAQGVESADQIELLARDQIAGGQGYYFGMPLPDGLNNCQRGNVPC